VPKERFASGDWYDVWFPNLAPGIETMKLGQQADTEPKWNVFAKKYRSEMSTPAARHDLALLAALSHSASFSVGCYCENQSRCHRSILKELLAGLGARFA